MPWRSRYLANLMTLASCDFQVDNREFLLLLEIERRLNLHKDVYIQAACEARAAMRLQPIPQLILRKRHVIDLLMMASVDQEIAAVEICLIEEFAAAHGISPGQLGRLRKRALSRADDLLAEAIVRFGISVSE